MKSPKIYYFSIFLSRIDKYNNFNLSYVSDNPISVTFAYRISFSLSIAMQSLSKKFYKLLRTLPCIFRIFNKYFLYPNPQTDSNYQFVLPIEEEYNKSNQIPFLSPKQKNLPVGQTGGSLVFSF